MADQIKIEQFDSSQLSYDEFHSARFAHQTGDAP